MGKKQEIVLTTTQQKDQVVSGIKPYNVNFRSIFVFLCSVRFVFTHLSVFSSSLSFIPFFNHTEHANMLYYSVFSIFLLPSILLSPQRATILKHKRRHRKYAKLTVSPVVGIVC